VLSRRYHVSPAKGSSVEKLKGTWYATQTAAGRRIQRGTNRPSGKRQNEMKKDVFAM
jgi:hypothetical protein